MKLYETLCLNPLLPSLPPLKYYTPSSASSSSMLLQMRWLSQRKLSQRKRLNPLLASHSFLLLLLLLDVDTDVLALAL